MPSTQKPSRRIVGVRAHRTTIPNDNNPQTTSKCLQTHLPSAIWHSHLRSTLNLTQLLAERDRWGERVVTRNASFFNVTLIHQTNPESDRDDDDVILEVDDAQQSGPAVATSSPDAKECSDDANMNATPRSDMS